jgi:hypothetical protein
MAFSISLTARNFVLRAPHGWQAGLSGPCALHKIQSGSFDVNHGALALGQLFREFDEGRLIRTQRKH